MRQRQNYPYPSAMSSTRSRSSSHGTSSAFSANANPNEDWTKVTDVAERRRIQNRIAQRNYRKKLKRRLQDLERRASSTSPESDQDRNEANQAVVSIAPADKATDYSHNISEANEILFSDDIPSSDDLGPLLNQFPRPHSTTPPPILASNFQSIEGDAFGANFHQSPFQIDLQSYGAEPTFFYAQHPLPSCLTTPDHLLSYSTRKYFADDDLNPFEFDCLSTVGIDLQISKPLLDSGYDSTSFFNSYDIPITSPSSFTTTTASMPRTPLLHPIALL